MYDIVSIFSVAVYFIYCMQRPLNFLYFLKNCMKLH